jgi:hypothetical protein
MSKIKEHYQDEHGNWLPEAEAILAKATATQTTNKGSRTLLPLDKPEDFSTELNDVKLGTTMNVELNTAELNILCRAVQMLVCNAKGGCHAREEDSHATGGELLAKLFEALKNARRVAKTAARTTV